MIKVLKIILTVLVTSFFFFPFSFSFLPSQNTKNLLAVVGLVFVIIELVRRKDLSVPRELLILLFISGMVSLLSLISITYNQTPDTTYVSFIRSTAIWLSSALSGVMQRFFSWVGRTRPLGPFLARRRYFTWV